MICPDCNGKKEVKSFPKVVNGKILCMQPCQRCNQTGIVPDIQAAWIERGKSKREGRKARKITLREEASRLNISAFDLSRAEQGIIDPDTVEPIRYSI